MSQCVRKMPNASGCIHRPASSRRPTRPPSRLVPRHAFIAGGACGALPIGIMHEAARMYVVTVVLRS